MSNILFFSSRTTYIVSVLPARLEKWLASQWADLSALLPALHSLRRVGAPLWGYRVSMWGEENPRP